MWNNSKYLTCAAKSYKATTYCTCGLGLGLRGGGGGGLFVAATDETPFPLDAGEYGGGGA